MGEGHERRQGRGEDRGGVRTGQRRGLDGAWTGGGGDVTRSPQMWEWGGGSERGREESQGRAGKGTGGSGHVDVEGWSRQEKGVERKRTEEDE